MGKTMQSLSLLKETGDDLFAQAKTIATGKESIFSAHFLIDTNCIIQPPCLHCNWRGRDRLDSNYRRRMPKDELIKRALEAKAEGINRIYLVTGYLGHELPEFVYEYIRAIKEQVDIPLFYMNGPVNRASLILLKEAGMDGWLCHIETPNQALFSKVRPGDNLNDRINSLAFAKELGLKTWSGFIIGLGEKIADIAKGIDMLKALSVDSIHYGTFHPAPGTEMERQKSLPHPYWVAKIQAATRILIPDIDLFSSYENVEWGFTAGCNGVLSPNAFHSINSREISRIGKMRDGTALKPC